MKKKAVCKTARRAHSQKNLAIKKQMDASGTIKENYDAKTIAVIKTHSISITEKHFENLEEELIHENVFLKSFLNEGPTQLTSLTNNPLLMIVKKQKYSIVILVQLVDCVCWWIKKWQSEDWGEWKNKKIIDTEKYFRKVYEQWKNN